MKVLRIEPDLGAELTSEPISSRLRMLQMPMRTGCTPEIKRQTGIHDPTRLPLSDFGALEARRLLGPWPTLR